MAGADRAAGAILLPYPAWTSFATTLKPSTVARDPDRPASQARLLDRASYNAAHYLIVHK